MTVETDKSDDTGNIQYVKAIAQSQADKDVAREKGKVEPYATVLPTPHAFIERKEGFDRSAFELTGDTLLVVCACVGGIPVWLEMLIGSSRAQWQRRLGSLERKRFGDRRR